VRGKPHAAEGEARDVQGAVVQEEREEKVCEEGDQGFEEQGEGGETGCGVPEGGEVGGGGGWGVGF